MVNFIFNLASIMGIGLIALAIVLLILALTKQPIEGGRVIQNLLLALCYFCAGVILVLYGWRFDPLMQLSQFVLVGSIAYLVVKDLSR